MRPVARLTPQDWMQSPAVKAVIAALEADGGEVRFVGGCVRDMLAGRPIKDIDLATPMAPETVMQKLEASGLKVVPTGLKHGTVTAVSRGRPFEVTTLREDVETDGRHAIVTFTDSWEADAARRDLTINALSLSPAGDLYDPFGGREDLAAGRVRFVGSAETRIAEDYLRLLRFFRFHAYYGRGEPDPEGLAAAEAQAPGLTRLSAERIRDELMRLLAAPDPSHLLALMARHGILAQALPEAAGQDFQPLVGLIALEGLPRPGVDTAPDPDPLLRLAALLPPDPVVADTLGRRLRLANREREDLVTWSALAGDLEPDRGPRALTRALHRRGPAPVAAGLLLAAARCGTPRAEVESGLAAIAAWRPMAFPLSGRDALDLGLPAGPEIGRLLGQVEDWWLERDRQPDRTACRAELSRLSGG